MSDEPILINEATRRAFAQGVAAAADPVNEQAIREGGDAVTTLRSRWLLLPCPVCRHTFRLGDAVRISKDGRVVHHLPELPCAEGGEPRVAAVPEALEFFRGLDDAWPPPQEAPVVCLDAQHELTAPPSGGFPRRKCVVCAHTFRPGDLVVICPCSAANPHCRAAAHRDPIHNLPCLEAWNPAADPNKPCPITSRAVHG